MSRRHLAVVIAACLVMTALFAIGAAPGWQPVPDFTVSANAQGPALPVAVADGVGSTGAFPDDSNTGAPPGIQLSAYTGPCVITVPGTIITAKQINCDVVVRTRGVRILDSSIRGRLVSNLPTGSVFVADTTIDGGRQETFPAVSLVNLTLLRVEVTGGQHSVQCSMRCLVQDSWLHDQYLSADSSGHVNAFISNGGNEISLVHNTLFCTVRPTKFRGGCTADASFFGDFGRISAVKIDRNLFKANSTGAGYCLQAGDNAEKTYPKAAGVVVTNNVFERGSNNRCGIYGPVASFPTDDPTSRWVNNLWLDGTVLLP
jgi:hypothetical protein